MPLQSWLTIIGCINQNLKMLYKSIWKYRLSTQKVKNVVRVLFINTVVNFFYHHHVVYYETMFGKFFHRCIVVVIPHWVYYLHTKERWNWLAFYDKMLNSELQRRCCTTDVQLPILPPAHTHNCVYNDNYYKLSAYTATLLSCLLLLLL